MDFNKIKEKYPKAWEKCDNFIGCTWLELWHKESIYVLSGWLFRFFDEQGIFITVEFNMFFHFNWKFITTPEIDKVGHSDYDYSTRTEAKEKAFEKAFEILENKLGL